MQTTEAHSHKTSGHKRHIHTHTQTHTLTDTNLHQTNMTDHNGQKESESREGGGSAEGWLSRGGGMCG